MQLQQPTLRAPSRATAAHRANVVAGSDVASSIGLGWGDGLDTPVTPWLHFEGF